MTFRKISKTEYIFTTTDPETNENFDARVSLGRPVKKFSGPGAIRPARGFGPGLLARVTAAETGEALWAEEFHDRLGRISETRAQSIAGIVMRSFQDQLDREGAASAMDREKLRAFRADRVDPLC